jgi:hypothetical protein
MPTNAGVGRSTDRNARRAGREAATQACAPLGGERADLVLVFGTSGYDPEPLIAGIREVTGGAPLSGCSGEGIISGSRSDETDYSVGVLALRSDRLKFETILVHGYAEDSAAAGREIARRVRQSARGDAIGLFLFPDGLVGNCSQLLASLDEALDHGIPVVGGAAGDALQFQRTVQFQDGEVATGAVAAVLVRGPGRMEIAVSHGCSPIGLDRRVTRTDGVWMNEIDGRPAWSVFKEYLDGDPDTLRGEEIGHLCLGEPLPAEALPEYEPYLIRAPLSLDAESGSLLFPGGGLVTGAPIRLTRRDPQRVVTTARECAAKIARRHPECRPEFVLQFDCAARGRMLFGMHVAEQIVTPLQEALGPKVPWFGFHTYGEIAPIAGHTRYHNYTVALCAVYETNG